MRIRVPLMAAALALGLGSAVVAAATAIDAPARPGPPAVRVDPPSRALVIGDSALASLRWAPGAANVLAGFDHVLDLETCRRLATLSCPGRTGAPPPTALDVVVRAGDDFDVLVLAVGYNELPDEMAGSFARVVDAARARGYRAIVWWTLRHRSPTTNAGRNDRTVRDLVASGAYPDVVLADWAAYSAGHPGWFAADGVHHELSGAYAAADYLGRKMAAIQGRVCPFPSTPAGPASSPCPDPDRTGPPDVERLYPIGTESVLCHDTDAGGTACRYRTLPVTVARALGPFDAGLDVAALQHRLQRLGHRVAVTGDYDAATTAAVRRARVDRGLPPGDTADVATLAALGFDMTGVR